MSPVEVAKTKQVVKVLKLVASESYPGRMYEIRMGSDGVIYCTCPNWPYAKHGHCKHLRAFNTERFGHVSGRVEAA